MTSSFYSDRSARGAIRTRRPGRRRPRARTAFALVLAALASACWVGAGAVRAASTGPVTLRSGTITISLSHQVYAKLTHSTHGAYPVTRSLLATGAATTSGAGVFSFPLSHARLDPVALTGSVASAGGIRFDSVSQNPAAGQSSTVQFALSGFALDFTNAPAALTATFKGQATYHGIAIAALDATAVHSHTQGRTVSLSGLRLTLLTYGAQLFNQQAYNNERHSFHVGESVGTATLTAVR